MKVKKSVVLVAAALCVMILSLHGGYAVAGHAVDPATGVAIDAKSQAKLPGYLGKDNIPDSLGLLPPPPAPGSAAFALDEEALRDCAAVFDRAALIALPPELRRRYAAEVYAKLSAGCRGLVITLEYAQAEREGPPFAVPESEVRALYGRDWDIDLLERRPIPPDHPGFVSGVSRLETVAYALRRH